MTKYASVIGFGVNPWDGPWMNRQQILSRLTAHYRVVYCQGMHYSWDLFSESWWSAPPLPKTMISEGVQVVLRPKWPLAVPRIPSLNSYSRRRFARFLNKEAGGDLGMATIAYVFYPTLFPLALSLEPDVLVYHAYDLFSAYADDSGETLEAEREYVGRADIVIASSNLIARSLQCLTSSKVQVIPNGADFAHFAGPDRGSEEIPSDLAKIPQPRIGYFGNLTEKVDLELIQRLADARKDINFIFVGRQALTSSASKDRFGECLSRPNVFWLGPKTYADVAAYMRTCDVNLLAYRVGEGLWSEACSPLKLYEYLAAGRPIVSAAVEMVEAHTDVVAIANSDSDWLRAIDSGITESDQSSVAERQAVARSNTWDKRIVEIQSLLEKALNAI